MTNEDETPEDILAKSFKSYEDLHDEALTKIKELEISLNLYSKTIDIILNSKNPTLEKVLSVLKDLSNK